MKKIINVGQCVPDHNSIKTFLDSFLDVEIIKIETTEETLSYLKNNSADLVLVNRKLDIDYTDGTILISKMQENQELKHIPIMLISNYPEAQEESVKLGGLYGFGKKELTDEKTKERVKQALKV
jgi:two-component system, response regulator, stage 0 sporulation protein F